MGWMNPWSAEKWQQLPCWPRLRFQDSLLGPSRMLGFPSKHHWLGKTSQIPCVMINCYLRLTQVKSSSQLVSYICVYVLVFDFEVCLLCVCVLLSTFCWDFIGGYKRILTMQSLHSPEDGPPREKPGLFKEACPGKAWCFWVEARTCSLLLVTKRVLRTILCFFCLFPLMFLWFQAMISQILVSCVCIISGDDHSYSWYWIMAGPCIIYGFCSAA